MEREKDTKKELEEQVEEIKKSNKVIKNLLIVLVVIILFGTCFGGGFLIGQKLADKEEDLLEENKKDDKTEEKEETKTDTPEKEEEKVDNTISDALRKDLDKRVNLTYHFVLSKLRYDDSKEFKFVFGEDKSLNDYAYFADATYNYYIYKTGKTIQKWSTNDMSYGPCYKDGQNGYCYPIDKNEILKYEKEYLNMGIKIFDLKVGYSIVKDNKVYVTSVPWDGGFSTTNNGAMSVERKDNVIEYCASHSTEMPDGDPNKIINVKYIFKMNTDGNFYLYSFEKM